MEKSKALVTKQKPHEHQHTLVVVWDYYVRNNAGEWDFPTLGSVMPERKFARVLRCIFPGCSDEVER